MSEKEKQPSKTLQWFKDVVQNLPTRKGDSFTDKVVDLESAKLVRAAGEVAISSVMPKPEQSGLDKGISEGLEIAGKTIIAEKLTKPDPIRAKIDEALGEIVGNAIKTTFSGGSAAEKELAQIRETEKLQGMFQQFSEEVVKPLATQVQEMTEKMKPAEGATAGKQVSDDEAIDMILAAEEKAKKILEKRGYSVESVTVTKEDVKKILDDERKKTEDLLTTKKQEWEKESGANVQIETERIRATEDILNNAIGRVFDIFLEPIKIKIQEAIEKGAFKSAGA